MVHVLRSSRISWTNVNSQCIDKNCLCLLCGRNSVANPSKKKPLQESSSFPNPLPTLHIFQKLTLKKSKIKIFLKPINVIVVQGRVHCAEHNQNLRIKTEPVTAGADATEYIRHSPLLLDQKPVYHCFWFNSARVGFIAEIQIIFGTVWVIGTVLGRLKACCSQNEIDIGLIKKSTK